MMDIGCAEHCAARRTCNEPSCSKGFCSNSSMGWLMGDLNGRRCMAERQELQGGAGAILDGNNDEGLISVVSGKVVKFIDPSDKYPHVYPSLFFEKKRGKPCLPCPQVTDDEFSIMRNYLKHNLVHSRKVEGRIAYTYLTKWCEQISGLLSEDWSSFGVVIKETGPMCPLDLFEIVPGTPQTCEAVDGKATEEDDAWIPLAILGLYRIGSLTRSENQDYVREELRAMLRPHSDLYLYECSYNEIYPYPHMKKLVAGIDMFFNRFPEHDKAYVRFGTSVSRYKDCDILSSIEHILNYTGMTGEDLQRWILVKKASEEFANIMVPGNEIDQPYSYMPYMSDMGISPRSPYSAGANPTLHLIIHMACSYLGSTKSQRSIIPAEINLISAQANGALIAYAYRKSPLLQMNFYYRTEGRFKYNPKENLDAVNPEPNSTDALKWITWFKVEGNRIPESIRDVCNRIAIEFESRNRTVGKWLKSYPL